MEGESLVGRRVGNWKLERLLGEGAFGAVYQAENAGIAGKHAAVKVLHPHLAMHPSVKQRFLNEASAASRADHENIVQIFDGGITDDGICYSVMELLRGHTLSSVLAGGAMDAARVINIGVQVAGALQAAHQLAIVHRDLKPDNLFVVERVGNREFVKVLDFGVAKLQEPGSEKLTGTGMLIGTPGYMAPEQWKTLPDIDGRADIYALGVILYECASGRLPFSGNTPYEWLRAHLELPVPDLSATGKVDPELWKVIARMLEKEREQRPQTMLEVLRELEAARRALERSGPLAHAATFDARPGAGATGAIADGAALGRAPTDAAPMIVASVARRPQTTLGDAAAESAAIDLPKRSRAPLAILAALVLLAIAGGGYGLFVAGRSEQRIADEKSIPKVDLGTAIAAAPQPPTAPASEPHHAAVHHEAAKHETKPAPAVKPTSDEKKPPATVPEPPPTALPHLPAPEPPPPSATPPATPLAPPSPETQAILDEAQQQYVVGHYQAAIGKARRAVDSDPVRAYRIIGAANCQIGEVGRARHAFNNTDANGRNFIRYACSRAGITLPP